MTAPVPAEIRTKLIIDGSAAADGVTQVSLALSNTANAIDRALGKINPLIAVTKQLGREQAELAKYVKGVGTVYTELQGKSAVLDIFKQRQEVLLEVQKRLETGTITLGQAQAALAGKIKTTTDLVDSGSRAYLEFMASIDKTAAAELAQIQAQEQHKSKLAELQTIIKQTTLSQTEQAEALAALETAYNPLLLKQKAAAESLQEIRIAIRGYREELGLEDAEVRKFNEGQAELISLLTKDGTSFKEATEILAAYSAQKNPAIKKEKEEAQALSDLTDKINKYKSDLGLVDAAELKFISGRDELIKTIKDGNVSFSEGTALLSAYTLEHDPAIIKEKELAEAAAKSAADRAKVQKGLLDDIASVTKGEQAKADAYRQATAAVDPLYAVEQQRTKLLKQLADGQKAAKQSDEEYASAVNKVNVAMDRHKQVVIESEKANQQLAAAGGLSRNSMLMLNASVINTVQSLSAGLPVTMVLSQQLPQLAGAFIQESSALTKATTATIGFVSANAGILTGVAAATVGIGLVSAAALSYESSLHAITSASKLAGVSLGDTKQDIANWVAETAKASGTSKSFTREITASFISMGKIAPATMVQINKLTKDYAAVTGLDAADAAKKLGEQMRAPGESARRLASDIGLLTQEQVRNIEAMEAAGDRQGAATTLMEAYTQRIKDARLELNGAVRGWQDIGKAISDVISDVGQGYASWIFKDNSVAARLAEASDKLALFIEQQQRMSDLPGFTFDQKEYTRLLSVVTDLVKQKKALDDQIKQGEINKEAAEAEKLFAAYTPLVGVIGQIEAQIIRMTAAWTNADVATQGRIETAIKAKTKQLQELSAGGFDPQTGVNAEGLTVELQRKKELIEIDKKYAGQLSQSARERKAQDVAAANSRYKDRTDAEDQLTQQEALNSVRNQATQSIAQQNAALTESARLAVAQAAAWSGMFSSAQTYEGKLADIILSEAESKARSDALTLSINVEARTRQYVTEAVLKQAAASSQATAVLQYEVDGQKKVTEATLLGVDARREALLQVEIDKANAPTLAAALAAERQGNLDAADALRLKADEYARVAKEKKASEFSDFLTTQLKQLEHQNVLLKEQQRLVGASDATKAAVKAQREITEAIYGQGHAYDQLQEKEKEFVDNLIQQKQINAELALDIARQEDAWTTLTSSLENAFGKVGDAITEAFAKGEIKSINWGNVTKAVISSIVSDLLKMSAINPLSNAVFGTNKGTLADLGSVISGQSGGASGNLLSLGSKFLPNSWTSGITSAIDTWGANALGIGAASQMPTTVLTGANGMLTGGGATSILPGEVAAGTGLTSYLGPLGIGAGIGGLLGPMLANGNKAVGGLVGAGSGAAAGALAGSFLFPGVGTLVGALLGGAGGGLGGLLGTQKPTVGPNAQGNVVVENGRFVQGSSAADNGGDVGPVQQATAQIAAQFNALIDAFDLKTTGQNFGIFTGGEKVTGNGVKSVDDLVKAITAGGVTGSGLVGQALQSDKVKSLTSAQDIATYLQLAKSIEDATAGLASLDKSLTGIAASAKKAAADTYKAVDDELAKAGDIGLGAEYKKALEGQIRNTFEGAAQSWTPMETAMAQVQGQTDALVEAVARWNLAISESEIRADAAAKVEKLRNQALAEYDAQLYGAQGRDYLTSLKGIGESEEAIRRNLAAVGVVDAASKAATLVAEQAKSVLKGLDAAQLADAASTLTGGIADLAGGMLATARAADAAKLAQEAATVAAEKATEAQKAAAAALTANLSVAARANNAVGRTYRGTMINFDADMLKQIRDAISAGQNIEGLAQTLQVERATTQINAIVSQIDKQISVLDLQTQAIQQEQEARIALSNALREQAASLRTDPSVSPLGKKEQLVEAEKQFNAALLLARSGDQDAASKLESLGRIAIAAEREVYASTRSSTFDAVEAGLTEIADLFDGGIPEGAISDIANTAKQQLAELKILKEQATSALNLNTSSVSDLKTQLTGAIGNLTNAVGGISKSTLGEDTAGYSLASSIFRGQTSETGFAGSKSDFEGHVVDTNRFVDIARALGYSGAVGGGQLSAYISSNAAFKARLLDAVGTYEQANAAGLIGKLGYATGTPSAIPGWALVGEKGPEYLKLNGRETIIPNAEALSMSRTWENKIRAPSNQNWTPQVRYQSSNNNNKDAEIASLNTQIATLIKVVDHYGKLNVQGLSQNVQATDKGTLVISQNAAAQARQQARTR